jgi:hypothetical protein
MTAAGYVWNSAGENIAAGYTTPDSVMTGWMNSPGHRNNILSASYREIGVGYTNPSADFSNVRTDSNGDCVADGNAGPFYHYWTQNFGRRYNVYPVVINREAAEIDTRSVGLYVYGAGWAAEMRFKNENGIWSSWEPYSSNKSWQLSSGNGVKQVHVELRNIDSTVLTASDMITLTLSDADNDGMPDTFENAHPAVLDPLDPNDADDDPDNDGLTNLEEFNKEPGLDPNDPDTDDDGIPDNVDQDPVIFSVELVVGILDSEAYGNGFGSNQNETHLTAQFENTGVDLMLSMTGYDIDWFGEVEVYLNDVLLGSLSVSPDDVLNGGDTFLILASQQAPGINIVEFRTPGYRWGVTNLLLLPM